MKILVLGSGGREHALAWKIGASKLCETVFLHPGNAGTIRAGFKALDDLDPLGPDFIPRLRSEGISLIVIGPETWLAAGLADQLRSHGFRVVGPGKAAARLESSKVFSKQFMQKAGIPTAPFRVVDDQKQLEAILQGDVPDFKPSWPMVVKLDGLAAGKGVVVASDKDDVLRFAERVWKKGEFGPGPHPLLIEEFLPGKELSFMGFCDGKRFLPLASATDYKRVANGNAGPNTGGMGAVSPSPFLTPAIEQKIQEQIVQPILKQFSEMKLDYRGILYIGLMIHPNGDPFVLEFNARFGDPETQAVLLRLESDFVQLLDATAMGTLEECPPPLWNPFTAVYVVAAAEGYPDKTSLGDPIAGLEKVSSDVLVFFSGVNTSNISSTESLVTGGGRVLGMGVVEETAPKARAKVYQALSGVSWRGQHFRTDIAQEVN